MNLGHGGDTKNRTQVARIARATWRRDGFVSLFNGGSDTGIITTRPITFNGSTLRVNARITGGLQVEFPDETGAPIPGLTRAEAKVLTADGLSSLVSWMRGSDLAKLNGRRVKLRFYLKGGDLYGWWFSGQR